jgi:hypothetical protein
MTATSWAYAHHDLEVGFSTFVLFVIGVVELRAMEDFLDGFAYIIFVGIEVNSGEFEFHIATDGGE